MALLRCRRDLSRVADGLGQRLQRWAARRLRLDVGLVVLALLLLVLFLAGGHRAVLIRSGAADCRRADSCRGPSATQPRWQPRSAAADDRLRSTQSASSSGNTSELMDSL